MKQRFTLNECKSVKEEFQPWFNTFLFEPLHDRLTWLIVNFTRITPNQLSYLSLFFGILTSILFLKGHFVLGGIFFELRNIGDTLDGRVARLRKISSSFGAFLDNYVGTWSVFINAVALNYALYNMTSQIYWLVLTPFVFFLMWFHGFEGLLVANIIGGKKAYKEFMFKKKSVEKKSNKKSLHNYLFKNFFKKFKLNPPLDASDAQHLVFFISPFINIIFNQNYQVFLYIMLFVILTKLLTSVYWLFFYKRFLDRYDELK